MRNLLSVLLWAFYGHLPFLFDSSADSLLMLDVLKFPLDVYLFRFYSFYQTLNKTYLYLTIQYVGGSNVILLQSLLRIF